MTSWYVPQDRELLWYEREGEAVVFNAASGRSHYLNALLNEMLRHIEEAPRSTAEVRAHLAGLMDGAEPENFADRIVEILDSLALQGLIDPCRE
jgi:PqqD family protein of HPr-rel-A system